MEKVFTIKTVPQSVHDDYMSGKISLHEAAKILCRHGFLNFVDEDGAKRYIDRVEMYKNS